ncbi:MAG: LPS-assembly protein LptD [Alphaproteobacteria bacterium]|nr:LPS-assembly protein LptD [Alphaproteobacteria bacterium]
MLRLLAALLFLAFSSGSASAQFGGLKTSNEPVLIKADQLTHHQDLGTTVASGNVEIVQGESILLADTVAYSEREDKVTATGNVSLTQATGEVMFADFVELTGGMRDGYVQNLRALLADNSRLAANAARRVGGTRKEMTRAVYSPCDLCKEDPTRAPLWQIRAVRVVHDEVSRDIEYTDATLEMWGIPVAYFPTLSHPDPTVKQRSGILAPKLGQSGEVGAIVGIPYYWAISPSQDLTVEPIFYSSEGGLVASEYRQRFAKGLIDVKGSAGYLDQREGDIKTGEQNIKGHIDASARFDLTDVWRAGGDLRRSSDRLYLKRYKLGDPEVLTSRAFAEGFHGRDYLALNAYSFQGLRATDIRDQSPLLAPYTYYSFLSEPGRHGGRFSIDASAMSLTRDVGSDSNRLAVTSGWTLPYTSRSGEIYTLSTLLYTDGYWTADVNDPTRPGGFFEDGFTGRVVPQVKFEWRWPWVRRDGSLRTVIEPIADVVLSPNGGNPDRIPNEDSQVFELDETNLFEPNRFAGFDRVSTGQRIDYGLKLGVYGDSGRGATMLVGQSYAFQRNSAYVMGSGVNEDWSDYVGRLTVTPGPYLDLIYRFRLDEDNFALRRNEVGVSTGPSWLRFDAFYLQVASRPDVPQIGQRRGLATIVTARLSDHWSGQARLVRDLGAAQDKNRLAGVTFNYGDECFAVAFDVTRHYTTDGNLKPDTTAFIRLVFKNLGQVDFRGLGF